MSSLLTASQVQNIIAARILAFPTDTVAGIFARIDDTDSIEKIFAIKGRALQKTLMVMLPNLSCISRYFDLTNDEWKIIKENSPGQISFLLPLKAGVEISPNLYQLDQGKAVAGFRIPNHPVAQAILEITGPLAQTSLNVSGTPPICDDEDIPFANQIDFIYPFKKHLSLPSTMVRFDNGEMTIIRQGAAQVKIPSTLSSHYLLKSLQV